MSDKSANRFSAQVTNAAGKNDTRTATIQKAFRKLQ